MDNVQLINQAVNLFFQRNPAIDVAIPKDLMPLCIELGLFGSEEQTGWPLRNVLTDIDQEGNLKLIPSMKPVRKPKNTYWFFVRKNKE
ncbi:hypothetical protein Bcop_1710 [Bacteroides coprosuis DSM 18011]|uniref:Uncharacterized protein n=1 Tax=Bacteroides coprosuis DSM 18011 TaxID=679937 RepID=F3ZR29_9BACE|nr:hypothetical protein [Bacteroides coprosuis]EGJ71902.1 hypothetical protein Bcop_1710 [Bacteroides coprosuis DSM 18011]HJD91127.1 hypothetical protein [Bacteroides coprosuis]